jgi:hypothetical protein
MVTSLRSELNKKKIKACQAPTKKSNLGRRSKATNDMAPAPTCRVPAGVEKPKPAPVARRRRAKAATRGSCPSDPPASKSKPGSCRRKGCPYVNALNWGTTRKCAKGSGPGHINIAALPQELNDLRMGLNAELFANVVTAGHALNVKGTQLEISDESIAMFTSGGEQGSAPEGTAITSAHPYGHRVQFRGGAGNDWNTFAVADDGYSKEEKKTKFSSVIYDSKSFKLQRRRRRKQHGFSTGSAYNLLGEGCQKRQMYARTYLPVFGPRHKKSAVKALSGKGHSQQYSTQTLRNLDAGPIIAGKFLQRMMHMYGWDDALKTTVGWFKSNMWSLWLSSLTTAFSTALVDDDSYFPTKNVPTFADPIVTDGRDAQNKIMLPWGWTAKNWGPKDEVKGWGGSKMVAWKQRARITSQCTGGWCYDHTMEGRAAIAGYTPRDSACKTYDATFLKPGDSLKNIRHAKPTDPKKYSWLHMEDGSGYNSGYKNIQSPTDVEKRANLYKNLPQGMGGDFFVLTAFMMNEGLDFLVESKDEFVMRQRMPAEVTFKGKKVRVMGVDSDWTYICYKSDKKCLEREASTFSPKFLDKTVVRYMTRVPSRDFRYLEKKAKGLSTAEKAKYLQYGEDKYCMSRVKWSMCLCKGCKCRKLVSVSLRHTMEELPDSQSAGIRCSKWFARADEAIRGYVASIRGRLVADKTACCAKWSKGSQVKNEANDKKCAKEGSSFNVPWTQGSCAAQYQDTSVRICAKSLCGNDQF